MAKYFSQEWCDLLKEEINKSAAYEAAAKTWEGDFYFVTEAGGPFKEPAYIYVDLYHGKCRAAEVVTDISKYKPEFVQSAPYNIWKLIITKKLDSTTSLLSKQSKLTGNMSKVMRYTKASNELTNCTLRLDTEWLD